MKNISDIVACKVLFFIMAFSVGLWTLRIPTLRDQFQTDYVGISYIVAIFAIGSIIAMFFANYVLLFVSSKNILIYSSLTNWLLWLLVPFIKDVPTFIPIAFLFGICFGFFEVCINLQASKIEVREKKSMMAGFHAFWSLGVLCGSFLTSLFLQWEISILVNILSYVIIMLPLNILFCIKLKEDKKTLQKNKNNIFFIWPVLMILLVIISMANVLTEGSVDTWGGLYMKDFINVVGFQIGIATISFNIFMVLGRIYGDYFRDKLGVYRLLLILIFLTIISLVILTLMSTILSSILGFALLGLGSSAIVPMCYSLASNIRGVNSGVGITIISIAVYGTFVAAPAGLGIVANSYGINNIFTAILIIFIFLLIPVTVFKKELKL